MTWDANKNVVGSPDRVGTEARNSGRPHPVVLFLLVVIVLGLLSLIGVVGYVGYNLLTLPQRISESAKGQISSSVSKMRETGEAVARRIQEALKFTPTVMVDEQVVSHGSTDVRHLVLRETEFTQERAFTHTFLGSTKRLEIHADFRARSGIDLGRETKITVSTAGVVVELPAPEVLSVEMGELRFVQDSDGLWNRIRPDERQEHINTVVLRAHDTAARLLPADESREAARRVLTEALAPLSDVPVRIVFNDEAPHVSAKGGLQGRPLN